MQRRPEHSARGRKFRIGDAVDQNSRVRRSPSRQKEPQHRSQSALGLSCFWNRPVIFKLNTGIGRSGIEPKTAKHSHY